MPFMIMEQFVFHIFLEGDAHIMYKALKIPSFTSLFGKTGGDKGVGYSAQGDKNERLWMDEAGTSQTTYTSRKKMHGPDTIPG